MGLAGWLSFSKDALFLLTFVAQCNAMSISVYVPVGISNTECINTLWNDSSQYKKLKICLSVLILTANFPVSIENLKQTSQFQTDRYSHQLGSNGRQFTHCSLKILCCLILTETFQLGLKHSESFILPAYYQHF